MEKLPRESLLDWKLGIYVLAILASVATNTILTSRFGIDSNISSAIGLFVMLVCFFPVVKPRGKRTWRALAGEVFIAAIISVIDFVVLTEIHKSST